jgi:hypothetical protein
MKNAALMQGINLIIISFNIELIFFLFMDALPFSLNISFYAAAFIIATALFLSLFVIFQITFFLIITFVHIIKFINKLVRALFGYPLKLHEKNSAFYRYFYAKA